jgi:hypothetical protein
MSKSDFAWTVPLCLCLSFSVGALAQSLDLKKGPEISAERKSEQGLEHGKAYAGSKEKKKGEESYDDEGEVKKAEKEKAEKRIKEEKSKRERVAEQEREQSEKLESKGKEKSKSKNKADRSKFKKKKKGS